jgi:putative toxin-antitoxin system antitoxin component (TIGR02293 family)
LADADTLPSPETAGFRSVTELLGGERVFRTPVRDAFDAHDALAAGLLARAVTSLAEHLIVLDFDPAVLKALGMSLRTAQRKNNAPTKRLSQDQSSRAWKFAEVLARATELFGGQEQAEQWLIRPAIGLGQRRPIDLLATLAGVDLVQDHLTQLEFGVYA